MMMMRNGFVVGDQVAKHGSTGLLEFGQVHEATDGDHLIAIWDSDLPPDDLNVVEENLRNPNLWGRKLPQIVMFDRPVPIGTTVSYNGKVGQIMKTERIITAKLCDPLNPIGSSPPIIFPKLQEQWLRPIWNAKVGDNVMHKSWIGVVTEGTVDVTYKFENDVTVTVTENLKRVQKTHYLGKRLKKLDKAVLQKGIWSRGLKLVNSLTYRNYSVVVYKLTIKSLTIKWIDRIRKTDSNGLEPPELITGRAEIASVFSLEDPTIDKYAKNSILMLRWDDDLYDTYQNWREGFENEHIWKDDVYKNNDEDMEPLVPMRKEPVGFTTSDFVAVKIMVYVTKVEIMFDDNSVKSIWSREIEEVLPAPMNMEVFPEHFYEVGDVVKEQTVSDSFNSTESSKDFKYGFVMRHNPIGDSVKVLWLRVSGDNSVYTEIKEVSQFEIEPVNKYRLLKNKPQIVLAGGIFEGVITGLRILEGKVLIKCAEGPVKSFYPHELNFLTKKAIFNPTDGSCVINTIPGTQETEIHVSDGTRTHSAFLRRRSSVGISTNDISEPDINFPYDDNCNDNNDNIVTGLTGLAIKPLTKRGAQFDNVRND